MVKNLSANAGDMGSIPGMGRSPMPQGNKTCAPQILNPHIYSPLYKSAATTDGCSPRACAPQEKPVQREACALRLGEAYGQQ